MLKIEGRHLEGLKREDKFRKMLSVYSLFGKEKTDMGSLAAHIFRTEFSIFVMEISKKLGLEIKPDEVFEKFKDEIGVAGEECALLANDIQNLYLRLIYEDEMMKKTTNTEPM